MLCVLAYDSSEGSVCMMPTILRDNIDMNLKDVVGLKGNCNVVSPNNKSIMHPNYIFPFLYCVGDEANFTLASRRLLSPEGKANLNIFMKFESETAENCILPFVRSVGRRRLGFTSKRSKQARL